MLAKWIKLDLVTLHMLKLPSIGLFAVKFEIFPNGPYNSRTHLLWKSCIFAGTIWVVNSHQTYNSDTMQVKISTFTLLHKFSSKSADQFDRDIKDPW